jgi:hypothetical protein
VYRCGGAEGDWVWVAHRVDEGGGTVFKGVGWAKCASGSSMWCWWDWGTVCGGVV